MSTHDLRRVQERREFPTRATQQRLQVFFQNRVIRRVLRARTPQSLPLVLRLVKRLSVLRRIPPLVIGVGIRPEHVKTPDKFTPVPAPTGNL